MHPNFLGYFSLGMTRSPKPINLATFLKIKLADSTNLSFANRKFKMFDYTKSLAVLTG
jgi:hypothetical protein